ncbi:hypothetical protein RAD16_12250 [Bradyrhizobium sp. 18BD]
MTKTTIFTALRLALSLAMAGPAHAGGTVLAPPNAIVLVHRAHPHLRANEHATIQRPPATRLPDREEDPLAIMHFE